jgi:hypothetical protein
MQYGQRYRIKLHGSDRIVEGEYIQTKGDDENFPTFIVDGMAIGVHKDRVLGLVTDDCPVHGIERFDIVKPPSDEVMKMFIKGPDYVPEVGTTNGE